MRLSVRIRCHANRAYAAESAATPRLTPKTCESSRASTARPRAIASTGSEVPSDSQEASVRGDRSTTSRYEKALGGDRPPRPGAAAEPDQDSDLRQDNHSTDCQNKPDGNPDQAEGQCRPYCHPGPDEAGEPPPKPLVFRVARHDTATTEDAVGEVDAATFCVRLECAVGQLGDVAHSYRSLLVPPRSP